MNIQLLDCTLRDGGYVNDWNFGEKTINDILRKLTLAHVDLIEVGFLDENHAHDANRSIQPNIKFFDEVLSRIPQNDAMYIAMIDYGTCKLENIPLCQNSNIDAIRVIFKLPNMRKAVQFGKGLSNLGYKVFLQLVSITAYSDWDILEFAQLVNETMPYAVSIVDTYGLLHEEGLLYYFQLLDHNIHPDIKIGYHSHNNFQLAFSNSCELIKHKAMHDIVIDGTVYGMGKSAGNAPLELLAMYLNDNYRKNYDIDYILEIIDSHILRIYKKFSWGYSLRYFLSSSNRCHPNYINYLLDKKTISVKDINHIVKDIPDDIKLNYKREIIEQLYLKYQVPKSTKSSTYHLLREEMIDRIILILGPGKSLMTHTEEIDAYIHQRNPIVISINFIPDMFQPNFLFICNKKRYNVLKADTFLEDISVIYTSNISIEHDVNSYEIDYNDLLDANHIIEDNSLIMILKLLQRLGTKLIAIAGCDGFKESGKENYYSDYMDFVVDYRHLSEVNEMIAQRVSEMKHSMKIQFLTPSIYNEAKDVPQPR